LTDFPGSSQLGVDSFAVQHPDSSGLPEYAGIRGLIYPGVDVVMFYFNIGCRDSLENLQTYWMDEMRHYAPEKKFVVVGYQKDQRA
jgi:GTPase SAR1 family protein